MKEDLIVIPDLDVFKDLLSDARSDLGDLETEDEESDDRRKLALDVVEILDEKIQKATNLTNLEFKDRIWFAAHLYLLETVLADLFEDEDELFFEDEEEEESEDHK